MKATVLLLISALCPLSSCLYHQYYFVNMNMSWTEAQSYCRQNYTDLATIDSTEEMTRLISSVHTGYTGAAWIGLYDDVNSWRWSLDGRRLYGGGSMYINWAYNQPNNKLHQEDCGLFVNGVWHDYPCNSLYYFVCYDGRNGSAIKYIVINESKTWSETQRYCRANYTDLASVRNQQENAQIQSMPLSSYAWIGLYRDGWKWSDGGDATSLFWETGQPDNAPGNGNCAAQWLAGEQKWVGTPCDEKHPFFCYEGLTGRRTIIGVTLISKIPLASKAPDILNQLIEAVFSNGLADGIQLRWRVQADSQIFSPRT